jgi:3'-5' exoribonuclease
MKTLYVKDLEPKQLFENETFAIFEVTKAEDKNGKPYYTIILGDKTGRVQAKIWHDSIDDVDTKALKEGKVIGVSGKVDEYRGVPQVIISHAKGVDETSLDDFLESSMFPAEKMYEELQDIVDSFTSSSLKAVLNSIINDKEIKQRLLYWPAANTVHHEFRSGLLQHILEMHTISEGLERFYPDVDFNILKAGIVLHDLGKIYELDGKNIAVPYTKEGQLHGHIYMGARLFEKFAGDKLDEDVKHHIVHLILSHHGSYEFGSPVLPSTPEAILLTYIDNVSAKARTADSAIKSMGENEEFSRRNLWLSNTKIWNRKHSDDKKDKQMKLV